MARQPRIEYAGAFYHITSRGNLRQSIFFENEDREKFIEIIKRTKERYGYNIHAYVLMDNHYHLVLETPLANLNQVMQNINASYTVYINRKYRRNGHLFQGRYKAIVIDKDNYLLAISRYVHLNPVRAGIVDVPEAYEWSSYKEYIGKVGTEIADRNDTFSYFSKDITKAKKEYKNFVNSGITDSSNPLKEVKAEIALGGKDFIEKIKGLIPEKMWQKKTTRELPGLRHLFRRKSIEEIVKAVAEYYGLKTEQIIKRTRKHIHARKLAIYLSKIRSSQRNPEVGEYFGVSPQSVSNVVTEIENSLVKSKKLKKEIGNIKCILKV